MNVTPASFKSICRYLETNIGLFLDEDKGYLIESRLRPVINKFQLLGFDDLAEKLSHPFKFKEVHDAVVECMTTHETFFFRDTHPFEMLAEDIFPALAEARASKSEIKVWCAACSSGQEPYTIAMCADEKRHVIPRHKVNIIATDIGKDTLQKAETGEYTSWELSRGIDNERKLKHFEALGSKFRVKAHLRTMCSFKELNLIESYSGMSTFDIVFVRNVLIYFDDTIKRQILEQVHRHMARDGYLFLGSAENINTVSDLFEREKIGPSWCYRPK